jgi:TPP-dependent pyruvate/acetoin dehydrogenase alpha subunit
MQLQTDVKEEVRHGIELAEAAPVPDLSELYTDVLLNPMPNMSPMGEYTHGVKNPLL